MILGCLCHRPGGFECSNICKAQCPVQECAWCCSKTTKVCSALKTLPLLIIFELLEDADYVSSFLSMFPMKMPDPNARLKAKWDCRGARPSQKKRAVCRELSAVQTGSILCLQPGVLEKLLTEGRLSLGRIQFCLQLHKSFVRNIFALFWVIYPELERCKMN